MSLNSPERFTFLLIHFGSVITVCSTKKPKLRMTLLQSLQWNWSQIVVENVSWKRSGIIYGFCSWRWDFYSTLLHFYQRPLSFPHCKVLLACGLQRTLSSTIFSQLVYLLMWCDARLTIMDVTHQNSVWIVIVEGLISLDAGDLCFPVHSICFFSHLTSSSYQSGSWCIMLH